MLQQRTRSIGKWLLGQLLPPSCIVCDSLLPVQEPVGICSKCYPDLPWWDQTHPVKPELPSRVGSFNAPLLYDTPLNQLIPRLKYADGTNLIGPLARLLTPHIPADTDLLLAVPLHSARLRNRKYNQAAELVKAVAASKDMPYNLGALSRIRKTTSQTGQNRNTRQRQLSGAFEAMRDVVEGKHVCLIDDVWTTGSTAEACAIALHRAGATRVDVVTLCYVAPN